MLRNPAYTGRACFGKTHLAPRQRITRPLRLRGGFAARNSAHHEVPRERWIEIPVPAIVTEESFALAEERLERNKRTSPRRTVEPTLLQGRAASAATRCIGPRPGRVRGRSTITAAWDRTATAICPDQPATTGRSVRIYWTTWSGPKYCACWRTPP
jgi:hypothetical protein